MTKKLYRSQRDKKLFGLCGGLADMLSVDATLLRLIVIVTTFFTGGALIAIYFIAALIIPKEPTFNSPMMSQWNHFGPSQSQGYGTASPMRNVNPTNAAPTTFQTVSHNEQSHLDTVMQDIEKKAMWKEIQDLKTKLSNYEKGEV